jgi:hypothetical protein
MKRRLLGVVLALGTTFSVGLVGGVVASASASAVTGTTSCNSDVQSPPVITTNLDVPAGATCRLFGTEVKGNVSVEGSLTAFGALLDQNVSVNPGGSFAQVNHPVTIRGNLSFLDPAANSQNGFWGDEYGLAASTVKGNVSYVIDSNTIYPCYQSPLLYIGGLTTTFVNGNFSYSDQGTGFPGHLDAGQLSVLGKMSVLMGTGTPSC